jgi:acetyl esterase
VQASVNVTKLPAEIEDRTIPGGPTGDISLRIVRPQGAAIGVDPSLLTLFGNRVLLQKIEAHRQEEE